MSERAEIVVVGNGLFGSAAVRHLAERGHDVLCIGAPTHHPDVRAAPQSKWPAHRVYSSHNDAARLTRRQDRDAAWAQVTKRAIDNYRNLERESGIGFFHELGCLIASRPGGDGISADPRETMDATGVPYDLYPPGDKSWQQTWPDLAFPDTHYVAYEQNSAGYVQPNRLIAAQNELSSRAGARLVADTVISVTKSGSGHRLVTAGGLTVEAGQVLLATGGFSNFNDLLPAPIDITLKSEVIVLGEVSADDAVRLSTYPTVKYLNDGPDLEAIYMVSAVQYQDDRYYIKMGANTRLDVNLTGLAEIQEWFETDTDADYLPLYQPALQALWPQIEFVSMRTQSCLITYSDDRYPVIKQVDDGLFVAAAGNGGGAKGSDAWGELAADLVEGRGPLTDTPG